MGKKGLEGVTPDIVPREVLYCSEPDSDVLNIIEEESFKDEVSFSDADIPKSKEPNPNTQKESKKRKSQKVP